MAKSNTLWVNQGIVNAVEGVGQLLSVDQLLDLRNHTTKHRQEGLLDASADTGDFRTRSEMAIDRIDRLIKQKTE